MKLIKKDSVAIITNGGVVFESIKRKSPYPFGHFWAHPQEQCEDGGIITDYSYWKELLNKIGFKSDQD